MAVTPLSDAKVVGSNPVTPMDFSFKKCMYATPELSNGEGKHGEETGFSLRKVRIYS